MALVGYTNAGKSTLFNALTKSKSYAADQLFATLDTTTRKFYLAPQVNATLSDTVGFIRDLPHTLIEAFKATLEDTLQADLLLHVVDASAPMLREQMDEVHAVLREIGADDIPQFLIFNKSDLLPVNLLVTNDHTDSGGIEARDSMPRFAVSALTGAGVASLKNALLDAVLADPRFQSVSPALSDTTQISA